MSTAQRQYKRECEVIIGQGTVGQGISVKDLRITFEITKTIGRTPNAALIKIHNLTQAHENQIKGEFDEVLVNAGYQGGALLIFRGNIRHVFRYRQETDWITEIAAADGDRDFHNAFVNLSLAGGTSTSQLVDKVVGTFSDTTLGPVTLKERSRIRGRVVSAMARDVLDDIAAESSAHWSIQDGQLHIVHVDSTLPDEAIVITAETGMLDAPQIDDKGIKVRCLLNPRIKVNGKIWLNNNDVMLRVRKQRASLPGAKQPAKKKQQRQIARLDPDGVYKVYKLVHKGDTRGNEWETEVHCVALGTSIPATRGAPAIPKEN
jgi:hypothetical protein